jgi:tripartite-type tricarboxylate transporter receptor subunit TctC
MHLGGVLLGQAAGVEMVHIPYRSAAQSLAALLANDVQIYIGTISGALELEQACKLKIISSAGPVRNPALPNIPTVADAGLPNFKIGNWWALVAPRGTPQTVVDVLSREMKAALAKPDVQERLMKMGMVPIGGSPKELAEQINRESEVWRNVIKAANVTLN